MHSICIPGVWFLNHFIDYEKLCYSKGAVAEGNGVHRSLRERRVPASAAWLPWGGLGSYKSSCPQKWPDLSPCPASASTIKYTDSHTLSGVALHRRAVGSWSSGRMRSCTLGCANRRAAADPCCAGWSDVGCHRRLGPLGVPGCCGSGWQISAVTDGWGNQPREGRGAQPTHRTTARRTGRISASAVANFVNLCWTGSF